ncbi:TRAP transporter large permease [Ferviditalea candida]|uniref:TRAP transporter large permease n=1 Tax=Ferviditalea candida TaxID=3108399 RepID=A0ABU5ZN49_9BACL|nr:TRAP transporter large permease [Paenibacillaceae bacterium T2]
MTAAVALGLSLIVFLFLGVPIAFSIGAATIIGLYVGGVPLDFLGQQAFTSLDSFPSMAVPFFILAGALMETGGLSRRIVNVAQSMIGQVTGGLAVVTVIASAFFAAISGSSPATVAAIGSIMIPSMVQRGYHKDFAAAVAASGGGLGIIIPPSIPMIIYGITADQSIGAMFLSGFGPGILIVILLSITVYLIAKKRNYTGSGEKTSPKKILKAIWAAKWALLSPVIILGGIYGGIFTPTESAVIAVVYGLIIGLFVYKELKWRDLPRILINSAIMTGAVLVILSTATAFGRLITMYQIPNLIGDLIISISGSKYIILSLIIVLILFVGTFMETLSIIIIFAPLFLPVVTSLGVDPIHFGIIMVVGAEIGMLTPPLGVNIFVASGISNLNLEVIAKALLPFLLAMVVALLIIAFVPQISMTLVHWFGY